ncbi:hypothetical protein ETH_00040295 [Eimeria tenella]|uniref:Uncharacterized protein n=1 Tax=Eimeria tenella TaxID=5802 RepID=U6KLG9_EIMTE|nr:hypothetical protein ETH_00040295 [Eimeria tenella]CDJ38841.1 hypothetical protein ETH_00040295 [Eimeria tenella]|eukprot:XP_013236344.1 hypothetical protein ETH_00040295 [Eimeria tenella]
MLERTHGYHSLQFFRKLLKQAEADWPAVAERLEAIRGLLLRRENLILDITGDAATLWEALEGEGRGPLLGLVGALPTAVPWGPPRAGAPEGSLRGAPRWAPQGSLQGAPQGGPQGGAREESKELVGGTWMTARVDREPLWAQEAQTS